MQQGDKHMPQAHTLIKPIGAPRCIPLSARIPHAPHDQRPRVPRPHLSSRCPALNGCAHHGSARSRIGSGSSSSARLSMGSGHTYGVGSRAASQLLPCLGALSSGYRGRSPAGRGVPAVGGYYARFRWGDRLNHSARLSTGSGRTGGVGPRAAFPPSPGAGVLSSEHRGGAPAGSGVPARGGHYARFRWGARFNHSARLSVGTSRTGGVGPRASFLLLPGAGTLSSGYRGRAPAGSGVPARGGHYARFRWGARFNHSARLSASTGRAGGVGSRAASQSLPCLGALSSGHRDGVPAVGGAAAGRGVLTRGGR